MPNKTITKNLADLPQIPLGNAKDRTGEKFGRLTILYRGENQGKRVCWVCKCDCGNYLKVIGESITGSRGNTRSCGCLQKEKVSNLKIDLTNKTFGHWTVLKQGERKAKNGGLYWLCQCDCGTVREVSGHHLTQGNTISCGCVNSKGESKINNILTEYNISFEKEKFFETCRFTDTNKMARFDFYLPDYNCLIEYDGKQHFQYTGSDWNTEEKFRKTQEHDAFKNQWCKNNNIQLIRIPYTHYNKITIEDLLPNTSNFLIK